MRFQIIYILLFFSLASNVSVAQSNDSLKFSKSDTVAAKKATKKAIYSRARRATVMSAIVPGLGQAYNKKYWKIPVIYAALGGLSYWGVNNHVQYKYYSDNLRALHDEDPNTINSTPYDSGQLITLKNDYKKFRDIAIIAGTVVYALNIIDANVDAHLKTFDVSDDLSMKVKPYYNLNYDNTLQTGLTLKLNFK